MQYCYNDDYISRDYKYYFTLVVKRNLKRNNIKLYFHQLTYQSELATMTFISVFSNPICSANLTMISRL